MNTIIKLTFAALALIILLWVLSTLALPAPLGTLVYAVVALGVLVVAYRAITGAGPLV